MLNYLLAANAVLLSGCLFLLWRMSQRFQRQSADIQPLLEIAPPPAAEVRDLIGQPAPRLITIEIHNPLQLAAREQSIAGVVGNLAPGLIRREVYRQAADILRSELEKWDVAADVRVRSER